MKKKTNKFERENQVASVSEELGITKHLAKELLIIAGGDTDMVIKCSRASDGLDQCRARILDARFRKE